MRPTTSVFALFAATALVSASAAAQQADPQTVASTATVTVDSGRATTATAKKDSAELAAAAKKASMLPPITMQHIRPTDQRGINVFEAPKETDVPFTGFKLGFGAAFTQQFQGLRHGNTAAYKAAKDASGNTYNANQLITIGKGFI